MPTHICERCSKPLSAIYGYYTCSKCSKKICGACTAGCATCGAYNCKDCSVKCADTDADVYVCNSGSCKRICTTCNRVVRRKYAVTCRCGKNICCLCAVSCVNCGKWMCKECDQECSECHVHYCHACQEYIDGMCRNCAPIPRDVETLDTEDDKMALSNEISNWRTIRGSIMTGLKRCLHPSKIYSPPPATIQDNRADERSVVNFNRSQATERNHSVKPTNWPMFKKPFEKRPVYMGMEWELNFKDKDRDNVFAVVEKIIPGCYIWKHDGSVNPGSELVLAPRTLASYADFPLYDLCIELQENGARGYSMNQCGIHIHVDKSSFPVAAMKNIMAFFIINRTFIRRFSQRTEQRLTQYAKIPMWLGQWFNGTHASDRYMAINRTSETWEFRCFRSTTNYDRVKSTLIFVDAIIAWAQRVSFMTACSPTSELSFRNFVEVEPRYQFLHKYLQKALPELCFATEFPAQIDAEPPDDIDDDHNDDFGDTWQSSDDEDEYQDGDG